MMSASARMQGIVAQTTVAYLHIVPANRRRNVYLRLAECGSENEKQTSRWPARIHHDTPGV